MKKIISLILFIVTFFSSPWLIEIFQKQKILFLLIIFFAFLLSQSSKLSSKKIKILSLFCFFALIIFQIKLTRLSSLTEYSGYEKYVQTLHQKAYISPFSRFPKIIEEGIDNPQIYRFRTYLFDSIDFNRYFPSRFMLFLFPIFIIGLFYKIKKSSTFFNYSFLFSFVLLALISPDSLLGPFILLPYIIDIICHPYEIE